MTKRIFQKQNSRGMNMEIHISHIATRARVLGQVRWDFMLLFAI